MSRRRGSAVAALVVVSASALAGCGAKPYAPLTQKSLGAAMTAAIASLHTAHEVSSGSGVTTTIDFDTTGLFKYRLSQSKSGAQAQTLIGIGTQRYLQEPGVTPTGKWLKLPASSSAPVITFPQVNPVTMIARFAKGVSKFVYAGTATIDGSHVHHYVLTIDQQKFLQSTGQGQGSANLGSGESLIENLYLNSDNTVRRVTLSLPGGVGDTRVDVTRWGAPVSIEAPPAASVVTSVRPSK